MKTIFRFFESTVNKMLTVQRGENKKKPVIEIIKISLNKIQSTTDLLNAVAKKKKTKILEDFRARKKSEIRLKF